MPRRLIIPFGRGTRETINYSLPLQPWGNCSSAVEISIRFRNPQPVASIDGVPHRRYTSIPSKQSVDYRRNPAASNEVTRYTFSFPAPRRSKSVSIRFRNPRPVVSIGVVPHPHCTKVPSPANTCRLTPPSCSE